MSWVTCNFTINLSSALRADAVKQFKFIEWKNRVFCLFRKKYRQWGRKDLKDVRWTATVVMTLSHCKAGAWSILHSSDTENSGPVLLSSEARGSMGDNFGIKALVWVCSGWVWLCDTEQGTPLLTEGHPWSGASWGTQTENSMNKEHADPCHLSF